MTEVELYLLMEEKFLERGASNNAAQISIRYAIFTKMVSSYGADKVKNMLENDFDRYHRIGGEIV